MKLVRYFVALVLIVAGLSVGIQPAHAAYTNSAQCTAGSGSVKWYIHGPYDHNHNGTLWSWITVVSSTTNVPYPPDVEGQCFDASSQPYRIDLVQMEAKAPNGGVMAFDNFESWRTIPLNGDSVYTTNPYVCDSTWTYRTVIRYFNTDANHTSGTLSTSWYHPC